MTRNCITLTNHTDKPIEINMIQDKSVSEGDRKRVQTIAPKDTMVIFLDRVEHFSWTNK